MKTNLLSKTVHLFVWSSKAFLFFFFLLLGAKTLGQYSGAGTFTKVTSAADFTDGYYVIAYGTTFAMNNTYNGTYFDRTAITPTSGTTITNPAKTIVWKIETNGTGKSIFSEDTSVYASFTGSSNNIQAVTAVSGNNQRWSFSYLSGVFEVQNLGVTSRYLQYNTSSPRFACYTGSQQDVTLYKLAVSATPTLTVTPTSLSGFTYIQGSGPSVAQSYNLKGTGLTAVATITAPTNFEVSKTSGGTYAASISYTAAEGNVTAGQTVYVRLKSGLTAAAYGGSTTYVTNASTGATTKNVSVAGSVTAPSTYTLTYNGNDNTSAAGTIPVSQIYSAGDNITLANTTTLLKTGYILDSWHSSANGNNATVIYALGSTRSNMPASNQILYARWRFGVSYDSNGGSGSVASQNAYYNGTAGVQSGTLTLSSGAGLTRSGYTFGGWKNTAGGTTADYNAGDIYTHTGAGAIRTFYAHWILNESTLTATPDLLSGFNYVESHGPSATQSFTVDGIHLDGSSVNLLPGDDYEISLDNGTTWLGYADAPVAVSYTGTTFSKTVLVRLKAGLSAGTYSNSSNHIIAVEGGGDGSGPIVTLQGTVSACLAPTTQSSISSFTSVTSSGMIVNLSAGNGLGRIIKINTVNNFTDPTNDSTLPSADAAYGGSGEQVIYAGTGNNVVVTGLLASTTYHYRVYEYNICSGNYIFNIATITNNPRSQTTACEVPENPNGEITPSSNPNCGTAVLIYEHGTAQPQAGIAYYWQTTASGTSLANQIVFNDGSLVSEPFEVSSSGYYYVRAYNGNCWSTGSYAIQAPVTISTSANISVQPVNQSVMAGANANFTVTASGTAPYTYQWQESSTGLSGTWTTVGVAATYTITNVSLSKNGYKYRVIVSNACASKTSSIVTLTVTQGPCLTESFTNIPTANSNNYQARSWTGDNNGNWTATDARTDQTITGKAITIRTGAVTSPSVNNGIGSITMTTKLPYSDSAGNLVIRVNGNVVGNIPYSSNLQTTTLPNINISGAVVVTITSSGARVAIDDLSWTCYTEVCTPATITAFPASGPANTIVKITGTNFTSTSTVKFGTATAVVEYVSATQLKAIVPANAEGNITVDTSLACDSETAFTLIKEDTSACEPVAGGSGSADASDIIIYEVYDENGGNGGVVTLYNRTGSVVNLTGYTIYRAGDYGATYSTYANLSGNIAAGAVAVIGVSSSKCGYTPTGNGSLGATGFNANDGLQLRKGSVVIDDFKAPNYIGYYLKRKNEYLSPKAIFVDAEWTIQDIAQDECLSGTVAQPPVVRNPPVITAQPSYSVVCDVVNTSLVLTATEGLAGGNELVYQWYVLGNSGNWTTVSDGGVYSGATTKALNITDLNGLNNFQYYCQVRESTQTCFTATNAAQIKEANNIWASNVWSNGTPVLGSKVIIAGNYNTQVNGILDVCDLTVNAGGSVRVKPNYPITVKKKITNLGAVSDFVVESDANLIQTDNVINDGNIRVERQVTDMNNISSQMDYVYWSSPVSGQAIKGTSGFSPNTPANGYLQYNETNDKFTVTNDTTFLTGKGYAIRAEAGTNGYTKTYAFSGMPNNGDLQFQNLKWTDANHGFNLIGNPYPSNIDFDLLYSLNSSKIYSTAFFWTNNMYEPQQMGSGYAGNNYAIYNITGGVPATYDDGNPNYSVAPNGKIKVGQAFIVQSKITGTLDFNNNIRVADNGTFYQKGITKNRFWLTMKSPNNLINTILIGYIPGATNNYETDFDGELLAIGSDSFYSSLGVRKLAIQGKTADFSTDDIVTLGSVFSVNGTYTIGLHKAEGGFDGNQTIYLRDKVLNKYINLSTLRSYTFEAIKGTDNTRFEIVYQDKTLNTDENKKSEFLVYKDGDYFVIRSSNKLGKIEVFDISGRLMRSFTTSQTTAKIDMSAFSNGIFILKAENSGDIRTKKINK